MKFLLVISCAFALASADVSHILKQEGFHAGHGGYSGGGGSSYSSHGSSGGAARFDSFGGGSSSFSSGGSSSFGGSSYGGSDSYDAGFSGGSAQLQTGRSGYLDYSSGSSGGGGKIVKPVIRHGEPVVSKAFFVHEAPADEARGVQVEEKEHIVRPRKHYNIVFVKTPVAGGSSVHSNNVNVFPENEEKTIIYVLNGRNDGVNVDSNGEIQIPQPKAPSKPEVVFVKYNNEADAQRAISDIQSQYNSQQGASVSVIGAGNSFGGSSGGNFRSGVSGGSSGSSSFHGGSSHHGGAAHHTGGSFSSYTESKPIRSVRYRRNPQAATQTAFQIQKSIEKNFRSQ